MNKFLSVSVVIYSLKKFILFSTLSVVILLYHFTIMTLYGMGIYDIIKEID